MLQEQASLGSNCCWGASIRGATVAEASVIGEQLLLGSKYPGSNCLWSKYPGSNCLGEQVSGEQLSREQVSEEQQSGYRDGFGRI
jgi:hypothetical protein